MPAATRSMPRSPYNVSTAQVVSTKSRVRVRGSAITFEMLLWYGLIRCGAWATKVSTCSLAYDHPMICRLYKATSPDSEFKSGVPILPGRCSYEARSPQARKGRPFVAPIAALLAAMSPAIFRVLFSKCSQLTPLGLRLLPPFRHRCQL
jgi:hypothetical protein